MSHSKLKAFTLLELLSVLLIMSILITLSYPLYTHHIVEARRANAKAALLDLAARMENFYLAHGTYQNASLNDLGVNALTQDQAYRLDISSTDSWFYKL